MRPIIMGIFLSFFIVAQSFAGGGKAYPLGAEGFLIGAAPPPGLTVLNYAYFYHANEMKDANGDSLAVFDKVSVWAEVLRFIYFSEKKILGGNYGQHFFVLYVHTDLDFVAPVGPQNKKSYSDGNIPYLIYSPFLLSWHLKQGKLHVVLDVADLYIPLSNEEKDNLASVGRNFWTIEPVLAVTYMPTTRLAASLKLMYDFNTKQEDYPTPQGVNIDRTPGQEFHFDWCVSYAVKANLRIGVSGYYYRQVKDDKFDLEGVSGPLKEALQAAADAQSRVWAIGPGVWYQKDKLFISLRSQFEFAAREMTEGYNIWFKLGYIF
ncbi:SphA family protein [Thermodesulfatator atlanticus]